jgi:hypothetical protein
MRRVCPWHCRPLVGTPVQRRTSRSHRPPTCSRAACTLASPPPGKGGRPLRSSRLWSAQSLPGNPAGPPPPRRTSRLGRVAEAPSSPAASLGLTRREREVLALVAEGGPTGRSARRCSSPPRLPASTSRGSSPSWGSPVAARRPRSLTASASTSNDPRRPLLLFSAWQRMRLTECGQFGVITLAAPTRASCDSGCSPGRVDVSTRSNAL